MIDALRGVLLIRVNALLAPEMMTEPTEDAVRRTYRMPIPLSMIATLQLPTLLVYRGNTQLYRDGRKHKRRTRINIDYVGPQTPARATEDTWTLLHRVFEAVAKVLSGKDLPANWTTLKAAGVVTVELETPKVEYAFAGDKGHKNVYPTFRSTWFVIHEPNIPAVTTAERAPVSLAANINKVNPTPEPSGNPVSRILSTPETEAP